MSDLHQMPLTGHDVEWLPVVRARVFRTTPHHWFWRYSVRYKSDQRRESSLYHGPFASQDEAYASARRMVEAL